MQAIEIGPGALALGYLLLLIPIAIALWWKAPIIKGTLVAALRMTVQLLFIGLYLQVIFDTNRLWLTLAWLLAMAAVADVSVVRGCGLRLRRFAAPVFLGTVIGTLVPLLFFTTVILRQPNAAEARLFIPLAGMIMGNCMRANIIGVSAFYETIRSEEKIYLRSLAQGAAQFEALRPYARSALQASLAPTLATMATIGLVSLPGMMTGVILGGADPMTAIKYQIAIMLAIFSGTAITVALVIQFTQRASFSAYGVLDRGIFTRGRK